MVDCSIGRTRLLAAAGLGLGFGMAVFAPQAHAEGGREHRPNIVIIFIDDMGYGDIGVYGAQGFETPNIDQLAAEGMRFTDFYVTQPVCSASRAGLLTGCYPNRIGISGALGPGAKHGINADETTLAELLKQQGYATGIFGKWHLGHRRMFLPLQHGFDEYLGLPYSNDMWPVDYDGRPLTREDPGEKKWKTDHPQLPLIDGNETVEEIRTLHDQGTLTRRYTERAVQFIEKHGDEPFFLYVPHTMVHVPLGVSEQFRGSSEHGMYGDVVQELDWSVGEILAALDRHGLKENTLVVFTSDNGPWMNFGNHAGSAGPLREGKGTTFEGGVRVPCIMRWPGRVPAGSICREPLMTIDILPTIAARVGAELPERKIDGMDASALILGEPGAKSPQEAYFFYYHRNDLEAMRWGRWKLHFPHKHRSYVGVEPGRDGHPGPYAQGETGVELYDLQTDIGEKRNVADEHPLVVARMVEFADAMRRELGDRLTGAEGPARRSPGRLEPEAK